MRGEFTKQMEDELRNTRNTIIAAKLADPDAEITFEEVRMSAGQLNNQCDSEGRAVQRKLTEIKGLHLPADLHELFDPRHGLRFGIGKGMVDNFVIVDRFGNPLPGRGGSGKIFIYPAESSTFISKRSNYWNHWYWKNIFCNVSFRRTVDISKHRYVNLRCKR